MEQTNLILNLLAEGLRPSKIATVYNISIEQVTREIAKAIQERRVQRSRVLATLEKKWQDDIAVWAPAWKKRPHTAKAELIYRMLKESSLDDFDLDVEEVKLYLLCFEKAFKDGEIYEALCEIERTLHAKIRQILVEKHGAEETGWWREGIPVDVRQYCVELREKDDDLVGNPPYSFTTFGHLLKILQHNKNPTLFKSRLPLSANNKQLDIQTLFRDLPRLGKIRPRNFFVCKFGEFKLRVGFGIPC